MVHRIFLNFAAPKHEIFVLCDGEGYGVWRSWLAYLHGVQVVVSSSLTTPTKKRC